MSEFIEKLKRGTQIVPAPMGFRSEPVKEKTKILLVAVVSQPNIKNPEDYIAGADAGLLTMNNLASGMESLQKLNKVIADIPWGGWLRDARWEKKEFPKLECDFLIFSSDTPIFTLPAKLGRILELDNLASDTLIRAIDDLPVDAIMINEKPGDLLNWQYIASLQRLDNLLSKPLLVKVPSGITGSDLPMLWGVGVDGIVIEVGASQPKDMMKELRQVVDKASFPLPRKAKKPDVLLPFISPEKPAESEEEEEEPE